MVTAKKASVKAPEAAIVKLPATAKVKTGQATAKTAPVQAAPAKAAPVQAAPAKAAPVQAAPAKAAPVQAAPAKAAPVQAAPAKKSVSAPSKSGASSSKNIDLSAQQRIHYVEVAAFYIAERRGFAPGNPIEDWKAAEAEVDRLIASGYFAG